MIEVGMATAAISVERQLRMNSKHHERGAQAAQDQVLLNRLEGLLDEAWTDRRRR